MSTCRSCHAPIVWARTTNGRPIPLDGEDMGGWTSPSRFADGNLRATGERVPAGGGTTVMVVETITRDQAGLPGLAESTFYRSHFASCPDAKSWSKRRETSRG